MDVIVDKRHRCFGGEVLFCRYPSAACNTEMRFSLYVPPTAQAGRVPLITYLSGLTCDETNFMVKAGGQRVAAELGVMVLAPDTSPRGLDLPGEDDDWDFGTGAGFYVDATREPWRHHYQMFTQVTDELPELVASRWAADLERQAIFGHSMGGHGALVCALRKPDQYRAVSALAPVGAPMRSPWGEKAFSGYLGYDRAAWRAYDASELVRECAAFRSRTILIDQGNDDQFLDEQLKPHLFAEACESVGQPLQQRLHDGYDHSYYFVATFTPDHLRHLAGYLPRAK